jgi:hypothetical protein
LNNLHFHSNQRQSNQALTSDRGSISNIGVVSLNLMVFQVPQ